MGCSCSSPEEYDVSSARMFDELNITSGELQKLSKVFKRIDLDRDNKVDMSEFFATFHIESTAVNRRLFKVCDMDNSGALNFCEFVCAMWNMLTLHPNELGAYVFEAFDTKRDGKLSRDEVKHLVEAIHHNSYESNKVVKRIVDKLAENDKAFVDVDHFVDWTGRNPSILAPIIHIQVNLQDNVVGRRFWEKLRHRRASNIKNQMNMGYMRQVVDMYRNMWIHQAKHNNYRIGNGSVGGSQFSSTLNIKPRTRTWSTASSCNSSVASECDIGMGVEGEYDTNSSVDCDISPVPTGSDSVWRKAGRRNNAGGVGRARNPTRTGDIQYRGDALAELNKESPTHAPRNYRRSKTSTDKRTNRDRENNGQRRRSSLSHSRTTEVESGRRHSCNGGGNSDRRKLDADRRHSLSGAH